MGIMRYGNRSRSKRILASPLTLVAAFILLIILARAAWGIHQKSAESAAKLAEAQMELSKLAVRQQTLASQVSLMSSQSGLEAELRAKYPAVKAGESVAVIVDDSRSDQSAAAVDATATSTPPTSTGGWFSRLLRWFGL